MAWIWFMSVNFADNPPARAFADHFVKTGFPVPHAGHVEPRVSVEKNESGWECYVAPYVERDEHGGPWHLNGHGGAADESEIQDIDACANVLYERLRKFDTFRFALTGWEVGDWRSAGGLLDDLSPNGLYDEHQRAGIRSFNGLVISQNLWAAANSPPGFEPFSPSHVWVPYTSVKDVP
jgi:hypothetical protein